MMKLAKFWRDRDGVVAIEAAIIMPVVVILMAVTFEMGAAQMAKGAVVFATQQAAVVQSTGGDTNAIFAQYVAQRTIGESRTLRHTFPRVTNAVQT